MISEQQATATMKRGLKLTLAQVAAVCGVSYFTVQTWRQGTLKGRKPLDACNDAEGTRFPKFLASTVIAYAKRYGIPLAREPQKVVDGWEHVKPGPKPKAVKEVQKVSKAAKKRPKH
jgi:hypothetical protein